MHLTQLCMETSDKIWSVTLIIIHVIWQVQIVTENNDIFLDQIKKYFESMMMNLMI